MVGHETDLTEMSLFPGDAKCEGIVLKLRYEDTLQHSLLLDFDTAFLSSLQRTSNWGNSQYGRGQG